MSEEANLDTRNNHKKENNEDIDTLIQYSDQNLKRTVERQVTIYDDEEAKTIQETSFTSNDEVEQLSPEKLKDNHSSTELNDNKINTINNSDHAVEEGGVIIENGQDQNKQKCQCLFEVFECTIWALRSMGHSTYSFFRRNCCFCCVRKVDLGKREINDDDSEYWDRNLVENDIGDHYTYNLNNDDDTNERKATFHLNNAFDDGTTQALKNHCINKNSVGDTDTRHSIDEHKAEKKEKNDIDVENSTSNAGEDSASNVCHEKVHHEILGNNSLVETSGGHDTSEGDKGGNHIEGGERGGNDISKEDRGGHDTSGGDRGGHNIEGGDIGGHDVSEGDRGGHDTSGGDRGGHDISGGDCGDNDFSGGGGGSDFASDKKNKDIIEGCFYKIVPQHQWNYMS